jgi:hypothetical protein
MGIGILIFALVAALVAFLCIWLIDTVGLPHPINMIAKAIVVLLAVVLILDRTGLV